MLYSQEIINIYLILTILKYIISCQKIFDDSLVIEMELTSCRDDDLGILEDVKHSVYEREQELLNVIKEKEQEISKCKQENLFYHYFVSKNPLIYYINYTAKKPQRVG